MTSSEIESDPHVLRFVVDARGYCAFVERLIVEKPAQCYTCLLRLLSNLAASGVDIPSVLPERDVEHVDKIEQEEWSRIAKAIGDSIAPETHALVDQHADDEEALMRAATLWDDLADIYRDLQNGLNLFDVGTPDPRAQALWDWRFGYEHHWGRHLTRALMTVQEIRFDLLAE